MDLGLGLAMSSVLLRGKQAAAAGVSRHSEEGPTAEMELLPLPPCATAPPSLPTALLLAFPSSPTASFRRGASFPFATRLRESPMTPCENSPVRPAPRIPASPRFPPASRLDMDFKSSVRSVWPHERSRSPRFSGRTDADGGREGHPLKRR